MKELPPSKREFAHKLESKVKTFLRDWEPQDEHAQRAFITELNHFYLELLVENDELRHTARELTIAKNQYHLYYDQSPTSCFTFNAEGIIQEANLSAAKLLNVSRQNLIDQQHAFTAHVDTNSYEVFFNHLEQVLVSDEVQECELSVLSIGEKVGIPITLKSSRVKLYSGDWECLSFAQKK